MANPKHLKILKQGVDVWNRWREENPNVIPMLDQADLRGNKLDGADLSESGLSRVILRGENLVDTYFGGANLSWADLSTAKFMGVNFSNAILKHSNLNGAIFERTIIDGTVFGAVDLSNSIGLEKMHHYGPSSVGIDTVIASRGKIPEAFLRGCGVPETLHPVHVLTIRKCL